ncbi:MAG: D-2-hydroxyacid dehydrogenase [Saccharofermentans sp.]|nr:D-2-hydroxyacid dehydrogenase [Saccharofermentans sp.]
MHKVLVVMDVLDEHIEQLNSVSSELDIRYIKGADVKPEDMEDVEVIVGNPNPYLLKCCNKLKLVQLCSAGTEGYIGDGIIPEGAVLTNATGAYGVAMSEFMLGTLLSLMKNLDMYKSNQGRHEWKDCGPMGAIYRSRTLVVGLGNIGCEFAMRMNALGSTVTGIRRHTSDKPDYVSRICSMDDLHECLKDADVVASCLPGYADTLKVFDKAAFDAMKDGAYFINVGRGSAVDTEALCDALVSKKLAGAALDVTDPEPLPKEHRLWDIPNALITPHVSGGYHVKEAHDRIIQIAITNLKHLLNDEPFENLVDMTTGYRINH